MFNPQHLVESGGLILVTLIIFAESGLFFGFFLPGDTLLLSAGVFASQGKLPLVLLIVLLCIASIVGDNLGYQIGRSMGKRLFHKKDGLLFRHAYIVRAERFFERFGSKAMLLSHALPVMRTFVPTVAGVGKMDRKKFIFFDALGDIGWVVIVILFGYWFGKRLPQLSRFMPYTILAAFLFSFTPMIYHLTKALWGKYHKNQQASEDV